MSAPQPQSDDRKSEARTVEVLFDPSQISADPFSFIPESVELNRGRETEIDFVLTTRGKNGRRATFPALGFITWEEGAGAIVAEAALDPGQTRARLRLSTASDGEDGGPYPYHVSAEYDGRLYRSSGYPVGDPSPAC